jgi:hypothetical protein
MVLRLEGLRLERDCASKEQQQQSITDPSSRQRGRIKITNPKLFKKNFEEKEKLIAGPRRAPDTRTDWSTDCRS